MNIKRRRAEINLGQRQLAEKSAIQVRQIQRYENDDQVPPLDVAVRLADALELTLDQLAGRTPTDADIDAAISVLGSVPIEPREAAWR